jgi:hypothetical protein
VGKTPLDGKAIRDILYIEKTAFREVNLDQAKGVVNSIALESNLRMQIL